MNWINILKKKSAGSAKSYPVSADFFGGLESLNSLPDALIIVDPKKEKTALHESSQMSIPVIAILNSDSDPTGIAYPIPANDASLASVKYLLDKLVKAYKNISL